MQSVSQKSAKRQAVIWVILAEKCYLNMGRNVNRHKVIRSQV
jgi:hypothetical protein